MNQVRSNHIKFATMLAFACISGAIHAGEGFQVRYNIAGSLGGEMFAPPNQSGLIVGVAFTKIDIEKVTGDDGNPLTQNVPGGVVPLPAPTPAGLYPTYGSNVVAVNATGTLEMWNLALGYLTDDTYAGGRMAYGLILPYATKKQAFKINGTNPSLNFNPAIPAPVQSAVSAGFGDQYQAGMAAQAAAASGEVTDVGDAEIQVGWLYSTEKLRVLAGASLVLPTGQYEPSPAPDIGFGNFYTFRPAVQVAYLPTPDWAFAGKFTVGLNSTNKDNNLKSGNWAAVEGAAGYMTPLGPVGLHMVWVDQYQDDRGNEWGTSRFQTSNAGVFFTTKIPVIDTILTAQYIKTVSSHNAKAGTFSQIRMIKTF